MKEIDTRFVSAKNDFLFGKIFGDEQRTRPLCSLTSAVLNEDIWHLELLNPHIPRITFTKKGVVLDIRAIINEGRYVNIEMQVKRQSFFTKRTQFLSSRLHSSQLDIGKNYDELQESIAINFLCKSNHNLPKESWFHSYRLRHDRLHVPIPSGITRIIFIELEKVAKLGTIDESNQLMEWILFMNAKTVEEMSSIAVRNPDIMEAFKIVKEVMSNPDQWRLYEAQQDYIRVQETEEALAEKRTVEAREEGEKKGIEIGEKRGEKNGVIKTAKAMLAAGVDIETVCKATGLRPEDLT